MAPETPATLEQVDDQIKQVVSDLHALILEAYNHVGQDTEVAMRHSVAELIKNLVTLTETTPRLPIEIPGDVIMYVQQGRNPDIYTREFIELIQRGNQQLKGRTDAYARFRDILAQEMWTAIPDAQEDIRRAVESTGGKIQDEGMPRG